MKKILHIIIVSVMCICTFLFAGCEDKEKFSLSVNELVKNGIELVIGEDPYSFELKIENYNENVSTNFNYDFYDIIAKVDSTKNEGNGIITIVISPIASGSTTLRITSHQDSSKYVEIPIKVIRKLESISMKQASVFVKAIDKNSSKMEYRNNQLILDEEALINYYPSQTTQKKIDFYYVKSVTEKLIINSPINAIQETAGNVTKTYINFLSGENAQNIEINSGATKFVVEAQGVSDGSIKTTFDVNIVNPILLENIILQQEFEGEPTEYVKITENSVFEAKNEGNKITTFIRNQQNFAINKFLLEINQSNLGFTITTNKTNTFIPEITSKTEYSNKSVINFSLQAIETCKDKLIIQIYDKVVQSYYETFEFDIVSEEIPTGLMLNDALTGLELILFGNINNSSYVDLKIDAFPYNSLKNNSIITVEFFNDSNCTNESKLQYSIVDDFLDIKINEINAFTKIVNDKISLTADEIINNNLKIKGKGLYEESLFVKFTCVTNFEFNDDPFVVSNLLKIDIEKGVKEVKLPDTLANINNLPTIYVEENSINNFSNLIVLSGDELAGNPNDSSELYIGEMLFEVADNSICALEQIEQEAVLTKQFRIKAKNTGLTKCKIILPTGAYCEFNICVVDLYEEGDYTLSLDSANSNIASLMHDANGNISKIILRNPNYTINNYVGPIINLKSNMDATHNAYEWGVVQAPNNISFDAEKGELQANTLIEDDALQNNVIVNWTYYKIVDFSLVDKDEQGVDFTDEYSFEVVSILSVNNFAINEKDDKEIVYKKSTLGYYGITQNLHIANFDISFDPTSLEYEDIKDRVSWTFSKTLMANYINATNNQGIYTINNYGTFNANELKFEFVSNQTNLGGELYFYAQYVEYDKVIATYINISLADYIKVDSISLKNYVESIYLDALHPTMDLYPNISPANANNTSLTTRFVPNVGTTTNINITTSSDNSKITISYISGEGGSGKLLIIPVSQYSSEDEYEYSLSIDVGIGDGKSEMTALQLFTADDFMSINTEIGLTRHYSINCQIDFNNKVIEPMGVFSGSIIGNENASIINVKISKDKMGNAGLFTSLSSSAKIANIKLEGSFNMSNSNAENIGLLAGINEGTISNISTKIYNSNITLSDSLINNNFGGLIGTNLGTISMVINDKTTSTTIVSMDQEQKVVINKDSNSFSSNVQIYSGGVVGVNAGTISFGAEEGYNYRIINQYGYASIVYLNSVGHAGTVAGHNSGTISGLLVGGQIGYLDGTIQTRRQYNGGVAGYMTDGTIEECTIRTFVRGKYVVSGIVGYINKGAINNNKVQAIYDGNRKGIETSMLIGQQSETNANPSVNQYLNNQNPTSVSEQGNTSSRYNAYYSTVVIDTNGVVQSSTLFTDCTLSQQLEVSYSAELLMFYEAQSKIDVVGGVEVNNQNILDNKYNIVDLPFNISTENAVLNGIYSKNINIESRNNDIITVLTNGKLFVKKEGIATLVLKSSLNVNYFVAVKAYVTHKFDYFNIYTHVERSENTKLASDSVIELFNNSSMLLYTQFFANDVVIDNVNIKLVEPNNDNLFVVMNLEGEPEDNKVKILSFGQQHSLSCIDEGENDINPNAYYKHDNEIINLYNIYCSQNQEYSYTVKISKGASEINSISNSYNLFPSNDLSIDIELVTNDTNDEFEIIEILDNNNNVVSTGDDRIFNIASQKSEFSNGLINYDITISVLQKNQSGLFFITLKAKNGLEKIIQLNLLQQPVEKIIANTYSNYADATDTSGKLTSLTNSIDPSVRTNYLKLFITPNYGAYDYIDIINAEQNITTGNTILFNYQADAEMYTYLTNGIRIYKSANENVGYYLISYALSSTAVSNTYATIIIDAYYNNEIIYETNKSLLVKSLKEIKLSIAGQEEASQIYVAKGTSYQINVDKGIYLNDNIVVYTDNTQSGSIVYSNGTYTLNVNNSTPSGEIIVIKAYATSMFNGVLQKSLETSISMIVMDFVLPNTTIDKTGEITVSLSSKIMILNKMVEDIEIKYNSSINNVVLAVEAFKAQIKNNCLISYGMYNETTRNFEYTLVDLTKSYENEYFILNITNDYLQFSPKKTVSSGIIKFKMEFYISYTATGLQISASQGNYKASIVKDIVIISASNLENPIPVSTYKELKSMIAGSHYILVNDITIPSVFEGETFKPLTMQIASFNGNNHKIILPSIELNEQNLNSEQNGISNIGLFETVALNSVIKNVNIYILNKLNISLSKYTTQSTYIGLITGTNSGVITNCYISGSIGSEINICVNDYSETKSSHYSAGIVGLNNGYITHCRLECNITANTNVSGLVAVNTKHIASSYVKNISITNSSEGINNTNTTAGLTIQNDGLIKTSFVEGGYENDLLRYSTIAKIDGQQDCAGFIIKNNGQIEDCYSNISIISQGNSVGFVYNNSGTITRAYTSSKLKNNSQASYPFFVLNEEDYIYENCFYVADINLSIRVQQEDEEHEFPRSITLEELNDKSIFSEYSLCSETNTNKRSAVWFYPNLDGTESGFNTDGSLTFVARRPQLVAPNVISNAILYMPENPDERIILDKETNQELYVYSFDANEEEGSKFNPIIIANAKQFEYLINKNNVKTNSKLMNNFKYYRIVCDINYKDSGIVTSDLYKTCIIGEIEGNGLTISGFSINTNETLVSSGLFAQIGSKNEGGGVVKNLTITPNYINIPNASCVGAFAGSVYHSSVCDVHAISNSPITISAKNIAGGLFGKVMLNSTLFDVSSGLNSKATSYTNVFDSTIQFNQISDNYNDVSYSGAVIGVIAGNNTVASIVELVNDSVVVIGKIAGLLVGGVCDSATLTNSQVNVRDTQIIKSYAYGGMLAGHISGTVDNCKITQSSSITNLFAIEPIIPISVGGFAGLMTLGGKIINCDNRADIISTRCETVGGIVGIVENGDIIQTNMLGNVSGVAVAGGLIGRITSVKTKIEDLFFNSIVDIESHNVNIYSSNLGSDSTVKVDNSKVYALSSNRYGIAGGIVGMIYVINQINNETASGTIDIEIAYPSEIAVICIMKTIKENVYAYAGEYFGLANGNEGEDLNIDSSNTIQSSATSVTGESIDEKIIFESKYYYLDITTGQPEKHYKANIILE